LTRRGIEGWKLGKAFGVRKTGAGAYTATRAAQQTGSTVLYEIHPISEGVEVTIVVSTVKFALKNPMTGVVKSIEKSLRSEDPNLVRT
jgi:hypothetical protein